MALGVLRLLLIIPFVAIVAGFNMNECAAYLPTNNESALPNGVVDVNGNPAQNVIDALGFTYDYCLQVCGPGIDNSNQNFTAVVGQLTLWFLPYLSLLAQVPFFTEDKIGDITVSLLTIGTPTLALYSLFLTLFNWKWIKSLTPAAVREGDNMDRILPDILGRLQQYPMRIDVELLAWALALAPDKNLDWWVKLRLRFRDRVRRLNGSGVAQLSLACIVYVFAVEQALATPGGK
jgi:hypothetical protein